MNFKKLKPQIIKLAEADDDIELLWLYGSYAKGCAHEHSDIDLAVVFKTWVDEVIERRIRPELLAIEWQKKLNLQEGDVSILDMSNAPIPIAMSVLKSGQLLLSKNISRQLQEQQRIMSKWEIDYLYHYKNKKTIYG
ncbi:MAG: putative nucleotidyltransferase [Psychromonas sp.]|jgi:predicted nucleotidyltransferase|uniref:type VII toxin-antitoxin system MntA family adenylyltransferase antitoxin n=1 Tax=Psychromonas sp. TaxID=1884585 RepID=UPI0039E61BDA